MKLEIRNIRYFKRLIYFSIFLLAVLTVVACKNEERTRVETIDKLVGSEVKFGNNLIKLNGTDKSEQKNYDYQIVLYTDSAGCTDCAFDLESWTDLMKSADTTLSRSANFKFIFHPSAKSQLQTLIIKSNFKYPVYLDRDNHFYNENFIPEDLLLQCFLIDNKNKVLAVGNPIYRSEVWNYFKELINEEN